MSIKLSIVVYNYTKRLMFPFLINNIVFSRYPIFVVHEVLRSNLLYNSHPNHPYLFCLVDLLFLSFAYHIHLLEHKL